MKRRPLRSKRRSGWQARLGLSKSKQRGKYRKGVRGVASRGRKAPDGPLQRLLRRLRLIS